MSWLAGRKIITNENKKFRRSKIVMKRTKLPKDAKIKYHKCPRCSKNGYHKGLKKCHICGFSFEPDRPLKIGRETPLK